MSIIIESNINCSNPKRVETCFVQMKKESFQSGVEADPIPSTENIEIKHKELILKLEQEIAQLKIQNDGLKQKCQIHDTIVESLESKMRLVQSFYNGSDPTLTVGEDQPALEETGSDQENIPIYDNTEIMSDLRILLSNSTQQNILNCDQIDRLTKQVQSQQILLEEYHNRATTVDISMTALKNALSECIANNQKASDLLQEENNTDTLEVILDLLTVDCCEGTIESEDISSLIAAAAYTPHVSVKQRSPKTEDEEIGESIYTEDNEIVDDEQTVVETPMYSLPSFLQFISNALMTTHFINDPSRQLSTEVILRSKSILSVFIDHLSTILSIGITPSPWSPSDLSACMGCGTRFSFFHRKHHCRACGRLLCSTCCSRFVTCKGLGKNQRTCLYCFFYIHNLYEIDI